MKNLPYIILVAVFLVCGLGACQMQNKNDAKASNSKVAELPKHLQGINPDEVDWKIKDDAYWQQVLSPEQFQICRQSETERPFAGKYCQFKEQGTFRCSCCGQLLFSSDSKFDSGTGWPSFTSAVSEGALTLREDNSLGMQRTEVLCGRCSAHLGHVFNDGPPPSRQRFCINSVCLIHDPGK